MQIEIKPISSVGRPYDTEIVPVFQDRLKIGTYGNLVAKLKSDSGFSGAPSELQFVRFGGKGKAIHVLLVGMGKASDLTHEKARSYGGQIFQKLSAEKCKGAFLRFDQYQGSDETSRVVHWISALAEGITLLDYRFDKHKSGSAAKKATFTKFAFVSSNKDLKPLLKPVVSKISAMAEGVNICRDWSNEPSNFGTPAFFAEQAATLGKDLGIKVRILGPKEISKEKMGLLEAVGKGSAQPPRVVIAEYVPLKGASETSKTICFVGKGVTFDTGGISIKPSMGMENMKHDMTGAATIFGALCMAARLKVKNKIVAILGFVENMPDGNAYTPGQVYESRSGKKVEIVNTDAEGRLVLADLLDYAHEFKPDLIVDAATLTGAMGVSLGRINCGMFCNDADAVSAIKRAAEGCGERVWELPLHDEYFEDLKSEVADMKNSANDAMGGSIRAALFLKQFIKKGQKWIHLDIAYVSNGVSHLAYIPKKGATGLMVRTLFGLAEGY